MDAEPVLQRERLRYCESMYLLEKERKLQIERHAQFYLGIITVFLGLLTMKAEVLDAFRAVLTNQTSTGKQVMVFLELVIFLSALTSSFVAVAAVFFPSARQKPYPRSLVTRLFSADDRYKAEVKIVEKNNAESEFLREIALRYAVATERNSAANTRKSRWLLVAACSCSAAVLSYTVLAVTLLASLL